MQSARRPIAPPSQPRASSLGTFGALLVATFVLRLPALVGQPFCIDESYYSAGATELLAGGTFFRDVVDHKPPGIYLIYALVYRLAGAYNQAAIHAALILVCALTALLVGLVAAELFNERTGRLAGMLYTASSVIGPANDFQAANTELFVNLPIVATIALAARGYRRGQAAWLQSLGMGALSGVATLIRPQALAMLLPVGVLFLRRKVTPWHLLPLAVGLAVPLLATVGWLWTGDALVDAVKSAAYARYYAASLPFEAKLANGTLKTLFFLAIDIGLVIPVAAWLRRWRKDPAWRQGTGCLLANWLAATAVGIVMGGRFYPHYFLLALPPLAVIAARQLCSWMTEGSPCAAEA